MMKAVDKPLHRVLFAMLAILLCLLPAGSVLGGNLASTQAETQIFLPFISRPFLWEQVDPTGQAITFWHNHTSTREAALLAAVDEFNATNAWGITVTAEYKGSYNDIYNNMLAVLNTDAAPDLVVAYQNQAAIYQLSEGLFDINTLVNHPVWGLTAEDRADFFPGIFNQDIFSTFDNQRLGFPTGRSMEILYYNADWLAELGYTTPPATPAEFKAMACAADAQPFSKAIGEGSIGYELSFDASRFASWTFAFGGDIFDYTTGQYTFNSDAAVQAMTFIQDLFASGCAELADENFGEQTDFGSGVLLFSISSSSGIRYYQSAVENGANFAWNVAAISHTTADPVVNVYGSSISIPNHTPQRELAAWLFLKYLASTEVQDDWARVSGYFPVRQSTAATLADFFAANPKYAQAFTLLPYAKAEPSTPYYDDVRVLVVNAMAQILDGADIVTTLNQLNASANATLP